MPPKCKFDRETVIATALDIVRAQGPQALTARALAAALGTSPKPIFGLFQNMDEVQTEVMRAAYARYQAYIQAGMQSDTYPPYKSSGMAYIQFAKEEKELFRWLFMRDRTGETVEENREDIRPMLDMLMQNLSLSEDTAYRFHLEMWLYVHGIATMVATSYLDWDMTFVSEALSDAYLGLRARYTEGRV